MLASVILDQTFSHYTNLDIVSGKVIIKSPTSANVSSVAVKLEGESRTRLLAPPHLNGDRQKPLLEFHKILYKVQVVFPPPNVLEEKANTPATSKTAFTLPAGQHEYPFSFKLPFNNDCTSAQLANPTITLFGGINVDVTKVPLRHVKQTLPPTLTGFPGEAEIRYYVKATVNRPNLFKENARSIVPFNFSPIEPPRPQPTDAQVFARRRHQFVSPHSTGKLQQRSKVKSLWSKEKVPSEVPRPEAPAVAIDVRLPEPAILTCARELPLKLVISSMNGVKDSLTLQSLQIELVCITNVRAQSITRTEQSSIVIISQSNIGAFIRFREGSSETELDNSLWRGYILPNTVPPSFETCNLSRSYELVTRIGVKYEEMGYPPQYTMADLRLPVQIFSGITPPKKLLEAMANARPHASSSYVSTKAPALPTRRPVPKQDGQHSTTAQPSSSEQPGPHDAPPVYSEAPPSYEDAVIHDLPPVDGLRRDYAPPSLTEDPLLDRNEKG